MNGLHEDDAGDRGQDRELFRRTLVRVMATQVIALALLFLLQLRYSH
jgi:hypothetical protein